MLIEKHEKDNILARIPGLTIQLSPELASINRVVEFTCWVGWIVVAYNLTMPRQFSIWILKSQRKLTRCELWNYPVGPFL